MEIQKELQIPIGTLEPEKTFLKPTKVKIVGIRLETVKDKARKVVFVSQHPDKEEPINISSVSLLVDRSIKVLGTWFNLDKEGKLQKGSALVVLLNKLGVQTIEQAISKELETELDGNYLCFKAY